jgi:glycosyltransferase involved in cell wall biosynthesis
MADPSSAGEVSTVDAGDPLQTGCSVVVPVFNSEGTLGDLARRIHEVFASAATAYELIFVNDGSRDRSWEVVRHLASANDAIIAINLMRNYGQHNALLCGIRQAQYGYVITLDDDLQHPPEEIPKLLATLEEGFDVVYGTPAHEQHGFWRDFGSRAMKYALQNAMGAEIARKISAFRAFRTELREAFKTYRGASVSIDVLLTWATTSFAAVVVTHEPRRIGASNYTYRKLLLHSFNMITGFSTLPLRIATYVGFVFSLTGLLILMYVVLRYLLQGDIAPGFPFLASIIAIFSGAQLFALGIMGEYLARMYVRMAEQPPYVVREVATSDRRLFK